MKNEAIIKERFFVCLEDNGTLDTVLSVNGFPVAFSQEYASEFRNDKGELTERGFKALSLEAIEAYEEHLSIYETVKA